MVGRWHFLLTWCVLSGQSFILRGHFRRLLVAVWPKRGAKGAPGYPWRLVRDQAWITSHILWLLTIAYSIRTYYMIWLFLAKKSWIIRCATYSTFSLFVFWMKESKRAIENKQRCFRVAVFCWLNIFVLFASTVDNLDVSSSTPLASSLLTVNDCCFVSFLFTLETFSRKITGLLAMVRYRQRQIYRVCSCLLLFLFLECA